MKKGITDIRWGLTPTRQRLVTSRKRTLRRRSVRAARSVWSGHQSRVIESRKKHSSGFFRLPQERHTDSPLTTLNHHLDMLWMREAFRRIRKDAAPGVDGVTVSEYAENLETNLAALLDRAKSGRYRSSPTRRVHIPKNEKETRPISIPHAQLKELLRNRINDSVILRLIAKWLKAGALDGEEIIISDEGTPQGGVISPMLSNIYLHNVLDVWFEKEVKPRLRGKAKLIRFADDFVVIFERLDDAGRFMDVLPKRFAKYGLTVHPDKTKLVDFCHPWESGLGSSG